MGQCTTVTGRGRGAADGKNKGSEHSTLGVSHLIGPRIVAAGSVALATGAAVVKLPALVGATVDGSGNITNYVAICTATAAANGVLTQVDNADGTKETVLTIAGTGTQTVQYIITKSGVAV